MTESPAKKNILSRLRKSLKGRVDQVIAHALRPDIRREEFLPDFADEKEVVFARNLIRVSGKFSYCHSKQDLISQLSGLFLDAGWNAVYCPQEEARNYLSMAGIPCFHDSSRMDLMEVAVTGCDFLIARTGSVLVSSALAGERRVFAHAPVHVVLAYTSQMKEEIGEALQGLLDKYGRLPSLVTTITGPSRTADIEKTLVLGMHGPQELYVFLIKDP